MAERRTHRRARSPAPTLTGTPAAELDYDPVAMMPDVQGPQDRRPVDHGPRPRRAVPDPRRARRGARTSYKLLALLRRRHARAPHLLDRAPTSSCRPACSRRSAATSRVQNARMLQMLLAKHGGIFILHDDFEKLPLYFRLGCIPIMTGMPPFGYWEKPAEGGRIPPHRTDAGVFLSAEVLGAQARHLHQGRGRPLRGRSEEEARDADHPAHHARASSSRATCPTWSSSASSSSTCRARASARSCRSSTACVPGLI